MKIIRISLIVMILLLSTSCSLNINEKSDIKNENNIVEEHYYKESMTNKMKLIIDNNEYEIKLENNQTVLDLINMLPLNLNMKELNGNEKYVYLNDSLETNSYNPKHIEAGDVMLYGNNCLVIFYKSFDTSFSYTKIGHIDNLPDLGSENVLIEIKD